MFSELKTLITLIILSWALFFVVLNLFIDEKDSDEVKKLKNYKEDGYDISIKTSDMIYKGVENFIFLSIAGVFLYQQIDDHRT